MAKYLFFSSFLVCLTLGACQTIQQIPINYLMPAEVSFPSELRRVAIINNMKDTTNGLTEYGMDHINRVSPYNIYESGIKQFESEMAKAVTYHNGDPKIATESLAEAIAQGNYFDEVIICDSALRANDKSARESTLTQEEVTELTAQLNADLLISLENLQLKATRAVRYLPEFNCYYGSVDMQVYPTLKIYLPNRKGAMLTLNSNDSIFWEEYGNSDGYVNNHLINDRQMINEASEFAGSIPVKRLLPYWKSTTRNFYANGSVDMRDAAAYVHRDSWDKALKLWERAFKRAKRDKTKMHAALNIALYYETKDDIEQAIKWVKNAQELAGKMENIDEMSKESINIDDIPNFVMTTFYLQELEERKAGLSTLNIQMSRFHDDF